MSVEISRRASECCHRKLSRVFPAAVSMLLLFAATVHAQTVRLAGNHPKAIERMTSTRPAASYRHLDMKVMLALRNQADLDKLLAAQQDPKSPEYQHWLTPREFNARFGPVESDYLSVAGWLASEGFHVESVNTKDRYVRFTGTVAQAERVFGVNIVSSADDQLYGNAEDPAVPSKFASVIAHIDGLSNTRRFVPMIRTHRKPASSPTSMAPVIPEFNLVSFVHGSVPRESQRRGAQPEFSFQGSPPAFGPGDIYTFYDETPPISQGVNGGNGTDCIAVIEDSNYLKASVDLFDSTFSVPAANITNKFPDTTDPGINPTGPNGNKDEGEALLDIEWAHAVAPGAPLHAYIGDPNNPTIDPITDGIKQAVNDDACSAISISFASCGADTSFVTGPLHSAYSQAASQGQSVFVSAGDNGAAGLTANCATGTTRSINEMAADPNVTAVGGTEFTPNFDTNGNDVGFVPEKVWNEGFAGGATGGGVSKDFAKPAYQSGVTPADGMRDLPDVSIIASADMPGVFLGDDPVDPGSECPPGQPCISCCDGGTSLSAPMWAGISRLVAQVKGARLGNMNPQIYLLGPAGSAAGLRDVTTGNNNFNGVTGFKAGPGYDLASGWGTPDINKFAAAYIATSVPTPTPIEVLTVSPNTITFNPKGIGTGPEVRSFRITNSGKGRLTGGLDLSGLAAPFRLTATSPRSFKLAHLQSAIETILFTPASAGSASGKIVINSNDSAHSPTTVTVGGTAEAGMLSGPSQLQFPNVRVNRSRVMRLVVKNMGPGVVSGNASGLVAPFKVVGPSNFRLAPRARLSITVRFAPTAPPASSSGTLNINSNGGALAVSVSGTGV